MNKRVLKILILVCIVVPIAVFIVQIDFTAVFQELREIGGKFITILLVTFLAYLLGTIGWWLCLGSQRKNVSLWQLFGIRQVGETVGFYNPSSVIGGDMLKSEMLKSYAVSEDRAVESVVISRITAVLSQLLLFILGLCWLLVTRSNQLNIIWLHGILTVTLLLVSLKILFFYLLNQNRTAKINKDNRLNLWSRLKGIVSNLIAQTQYFFQHRQSLFWWSYFFFFLHWLVGSLEFYFILRFLGYNVSLMQGVLADMGVIVIKSVAAFVPGQIGIEELGNKVVLASLGIQAVTAWVTVSILRRARQLCWILIGAFCYVFTRKTDIFKVFRHGNPVRQS
ncbi:lysylphosphatidylglycerol synthase transmembrane domain-containing protein [Sphingobacterium sp. SGR-19]|uniref:lysylphosphatidylglycerol synthase transmembrane domain-containing protein n=1 Tax=Sphingobacterium sp. SGR-19 TaxID=2710886 RepID=UPI0013EB5504|nr:lysylphosphatidylglycerol synthase transmembrane domain-containing protein [Sphingobacterium sp. SGR-19]NGM63925.1 flippase-like domain-containing protein [Sphingobacterium sp. SGR-19]